MSVSLSEIELAYLIALVGQTTVDTTESVNAEVKIEENWENQKITDYITNESNIEFSYCSLYNKLISIIPIDDYPIGETEYKVVFKDINGELHLSEAYYLDESEWNKINGVDGFLEVVLRSARIRKAKLITYSIGEQ